MNPFTSNRFWQTKEKEHGLQTVLEGADPIRTTPFPCREVMGKQALECVQQVFEYYWEKQQDVPYQAHFEEKYCKEFADYYGGGFADAVNSGSVAVHLAVLALELPPASEILISPVTDPGSVSAVLLAGHKIVVADAAPGSFNVNEAAVRAALQAHPSIKAALITHVGGVPVDMVAVSQVLEEHAVELIEDCSQIHGGALGGKRLGTFGRFAAFSTMFTKNHTTGSTGGVVLCADEKDYWMIRGLADRQKPFASSAFNPKDPGTFLGPGLNYNANEIGCALGSQSLHCLPEVITKRQQLVNTLDSLLEQTTAYCPLRLSPSAQASYFFYNVAISEQLTDQQVMRLKQALAAEGTSVNADYRYVVCEWDWCKEKYLNGVQTPNATRHRQRSINILFHEKYSTADMEDIVWALVRAEHYALHN
ncbi:DegT/DnrJ/EryC1/StrS aminotransferase family protein [Alteromonas sp. ASW11-19]|uniref:DegT/DnrJ/EryC1/StrS aminotransferase family protein n=1 Tax=Alteromonas salexigens TaxID=2982530 RepID=A0ABT2VQ54_9ALTE|nr:DegT/DnrJ/EryC1/StrS aminotransferase family protein [Alteromonas salexigens]MCU7555008.1 DegT/DnrJ/EryC1/StrS aminotransferase family protein [Alteromonas salexigens]